MTLSPGPGGKPGEKMRLMQSFQERLKATLSDPLTYMLLVWGGLFLVMWACFALTD
jgi:hypothetical protein